MANTTISNLTASAALTGTEIVPVVQSGATVRTTTAAIAALALGTPVTVANGGTGATTGTAALTNLRGYTTTVSSATPVVLDNTSTYLQVFTGTTFQTVTLPVVSTLQLGWAYKIINNNTINNVGVFSSGGSVLLSLTTGMSGIVTCVSTSGTGAASWKAEYTGFGTLSGTGSSILTNIGPGATGVLNFTGSATTGASFGTAITSGAIGIGGIAGTGTITVGQSTASQTTNIQAGATASGSTKTIALGTGGLAGSTTNIAVGSTTGASTTTLNGTVAFANPTLAFANLNGYTTTVSSATPVVLDNTSTYLQVFTGATTQTVTLPVVSTLQLGWSFKIINNNSSGNVTVNSSGGTLVGNVIIGTSATVTCVLTSGTGAASWKYDFTGFMGTTGSNVVVLSNSPTITGSPNIGSATEASNFHANQTSGATTIGGTSGTGIITLGRSTVSQTTNIQAGATASGSTKTVNLGTGGLAGSTTSIAIGSTLGTSAITLNSDTSAINPTAAPASGSSPGKFLYSVGQIWNSGFGTQTMTGGFQIAALTVNTNPTVSKLSFVVGTDNAAATEKMYITSTGLFNINGGATFAGTTLNDTSNAVYIQNNAAATAGAAQASNKLFLQGTSWNSSGGNTATKGYLQAVTIANNATPTIESLNFAPASGSVAAATQLFAMTNQGRFGIGTVTPTQALDVVGNARIVGLVKLQTYTVATLPSASTSGVGSKSFVTDALAPAFGATVVTGGAVAVPVYSDGTDWKVG